MQIWSQYNSDDLGRNKTLIEQQQLLESIRVSMQDVNYLYKNNAQKYIIQQNTTKQLLEKLKQDYLIIGQELEEEFQDVESNLTYMRVSIINQRLQATSCIEIRILSKSRCCSMRVLLRPKSSELYWFQIYVIMNR